MGHPPANLLLITFDQWRGDWADPSQAVVALPTLQRLAQRSVVARRCYTSSPQCVPARLSWLTGLAPSQLGVTRNCVAEAPADAPSVFRDLRRDGWYTELIGKTHWTNHLEPTDLRLTQPLIESLGFERVLEIAGPRALQTVRCALTDAWEENGVLQDYIDDLRQRYGQGQTEQAWAVRPSVLPNHLYPDLWIADRALEALQRIPDNHPWLLWVSFVGPHEPFDTPEPWSRCHDTPPPVPSGEWISALPKNCELFQAQQRWQGKLSRGAIDHCRQDYANHLQLLDAQLDRLVQALDQRNDAGNTAIAVTADHGEMLGDHGMLYKGTFLEASIRVPFQYTPPSAEPHKSSAQWLAKPVGLTELFTRMVSNLRSDGKSDVITDLIQNTNHVCVEFGDELLTIQNNRKLCCDKTGQPLWATQIKRDPSEQRNLLAENPSLLENKKRWKQHYEISLREINRRQSPNWLWKDCKK